MYGLSYYEGCHVWVCTRMCDLLDFGEEYVRCVCMCVIPHGRRTLHFHCMLLRWHVRVRIYVVMFTELFYYYIISYIREYNETILSLNLILANKLYFENIRSLHHY